MADQPELFYVYNKPPEDRIPNKELLRVEEVATCLTCSKSHVWNLIDEGSLEATSVASKGSKKPYYRVFSRSLREFLERNREGMH